MKFDLDCVLLSVQRQPYTIDGRSGVAFPARIVSGGNTFKLRATEQLYEALKAVPELTRGKATIEVTTSKEVNTVNLIAFSPVKA